MRRDDYDPIADFWAGWHEALAIVRERKARGGKGWESEMSDTNMLRIARGLAEALCEFARSRKDEDKKRIAALHTELCREYRQEQDDERREADALPVQPTDD